MLGAAAACTASTQPCTPLHIGQHGGAGCYIAWESPAAYNQTIGQHGPVHVLPRVSLQDGRAFASICEFVSAHLYYIHVPACRLGELIAQLSSCAGPKPNRASQHLLMVV